MGQLQLKFALVLGLLRLLVFLSGFTVAVAALFSYLLRTKKISPFSALARAVRRIDGVLFAPMERRILNAGGSHTSAPWWTLAVVVIGGLLLLSVVQFLFTQLFLLLNAIGGRPTSLIALILGWTFSFLRLAIIARVIASWVGGTPWSKWWRWSFVSTEWFMGPLRRVVPTLGQIDISPLVAYFGIGIIQRLIFNVL